MAVSIISNKKNTAATVHVSVANTTIKVSGNSTTTNVDATSTCLAVSDETLSGAYIAQAFWGIDPNGYAVIKRGTTPVMVTSFLKFRRSVHSFQNTIIVKVKR